ncbi:MAG: SHOCT domain-containing protein [Firmicutes bacterium]|nr:SHOCT domain-containing protein [Bacillota bacterium]
MRTALEMYEFAIKNGYGRDALFIRRGLKHFEVIANYLTPEDDVVLTFLAEYKINAKNNIGVSAFALTNKKIIIGQHGVVTRERSKQVMLKNINDITKKTYYMAGEIVFQTIDDVFSALFVPKCMKKVYKAVISHMDCLRTSSARLNESPQYVIPAQVPIDPMCDEKMTKRIMHFKKLADEGFITQEEFEAKKRKIMGI